MQDNLFNKVRNFLTQEKSKLEKDSSQQEGLPENHEPKEQPEILQENTSQEASAETESPAEAKPGHSVEEIKQEVIKVLKTCYDPEIPVDVYELGLIYDIKVAVNGDVLIIMTLTSPACPVAGSLPLEIEQRVKEHPMINECKVQITFDPPWNQRMMSEVAMLELGFL